MLNNFAYYSIDELPDPSYLPESPPPLTVDTLFQALTPLLVFVGILMLLGIVLVIWSFIRKYHVQEATFRIDKNLQKLVDNIDDQSYKTPQYASKRQESDDVKLPTNDNKGI